MALFFGTDIRLIPIKVSDILPVVLGGLPFLFFNHEYISSAPADALFNLVLFGHELLNFMSTFAAD